MPIDAAYTSRHAGTLTILVKCIETKRGRSCKQRRCNPFQKVEVIDRPYDLNASIHY